MKISRVTIPYTIHNPERFKNQLLSWAQQFEDIVWLDANGYQDRFSSYDAILAVDKITYIRCEKNRRF